MKEFAKSSEAFELANKVIPGGVNSPVRAFRGVGGTPLFIESGKGAEITDIDGNRYIDYVGSWGPLILGHAHPEVTEAVKIAAEKGTSFGIPTEMESELAKQIIKMVPSIEMVRMVNSGTEATMSAIRLARGHTGRDLIIKFEGCYHGHGDSFLIAAGSGATTLGTPDSPGVTAATAKDTLLARFNDLDSVKALFDSHGESIAALIIEPVAGNMGVIPPEDGFLQGLRDITENNGTILIFDEVMTGFRVARGGAQELYTIDPDLTTLGKVIGGGLPVGAYGGKETIMQSIAPVGPIYQAGTLSGNPLATTAGLSTLQVIDRDYTFYSNLELKSARLEKGMLDNCRRCGFEGVINRVGSMMTSFFSNGKPVQNYDDAKKCDTEMFGRYFHALVQNGIYMAPSQFEAAFVSAAHTDENIDFTLEMHLKALQNIQ
jgi:glutamate-1-semialdehyde 2,1-aminomutase